MGGVPGMPSSEPECKAIRKEDTPEWPCLPSPPTLQAPLSLTVTPFSYLQSGPTWVFPSNQSALELIFNHLRSRLSDCPSSPGPTILSSEPTTLSLKTELPLQGGVTPRTLQWGKLLSVHLGASVLLTGNLLAKR